MPWRKPGYVKPDMSVRVPCPKCRKLFSKSNIKCHMGKNKCLPWDAYLINKPNSLYNNLNKSTS